MSINTHVPPDYESLEMEAWRENAKNVICRLSCEDKDLLKRINTYVDRFGYREDDVKEKIRKDDMFAAHFTKEPRRQGMHEIIAAKWIERLNLVKNFQILPKMGTKSYFVTSDGVITQIAEKSTKPSKSLDFKWNTGKCSIYAMHKYTKEVGGNQDSQFKEMQELLKNFQKSTSQDSALIIIVDGAYYTERKMEQLRHYTRDRSPKSYAVSIGDLPNILKEYEK